MSHDIDAKVWSQQKQNKIMILLLGWDHWCGCVIELVTTADDRLNVLLQV